MTTCVFLQVQNLKVYAELLSLSPSLNTLSVPGPPYAPSQKRLKPTPSLHLSFAAPVLSPQPIPA